MDFQINKEQKIYEGTKEMEKTIVGKSILGI